MTPTMELRFVERQVQHTYGTTVTVRILQQKWLRDGQDPEWQPNEWRDVPVEKEE